MTENLGELVEEFEDFNKSWSNEGGAGVTNLEKLLEAIGYDASFRGTIDNFLRDNSGAVEAIKQWIIDQDIEEWKENLESTLPEKEETEEVTDEE